MKTIAELKDVLAQVRVQTTMAASADLLSSRAQATKAANEGVAVLLSAFDELEAARAEVAELRNILTDAYEWGLSSDSLSGTPTDRLALYNRMSSALARARGRK